MAKTKAKEKKSGRFAYEGLDRVIHEKARLGILTSLIAHPKGLLFCDLKLDNVLVTESGCERRQWKREAE